MQRWYAVMCKARKEWLAEKNLKYQGYDTFFPHFREWTTPLRTKPRLIIRPYLTRYIFAALTDRAKHSIYQINNTIGVSSVVYCGMDALAIPQEIINDIKDLADDKGQLTRDQEPIFPGLPGDRIKFCEASPLFGFVAEIMRVDKDGKIMVRLDKLLGAERIVPIKSADVGAIIHRDRHPHGPKRAYSRVMAHHAERR